jgi:hypothetical protein
MIHRLFFASRVRKKTVKTISDEILAPGHQNESINSVFTSWTAQYGVHRVLILPANSFLAALPSCYAENLWFSGSLYPRFSCEAVPRRAQA